ncbi:hypothetical protein [Paenibacillus silviterrae]|uniref:hypothetical protein n=1 Tax=Paenibacillus silviterrae TaxID=3242194 RepID=UPI002543A490|nr:hypothetical protein [Paenibacillus chinjuensis]
MKALNKKIIAGIAGSLVLGGVLTGALQTTEVFANAATPAAPAASAQQGTDGAMKGGRFGKGAGMEGFRSVKHTDLATLLGIDQQVLKQELQSGKTIAQVAQEKAGLNKEALIQKMVEAETKNIDDAVAAGKLTAEQADKMKTDLTTRITQSVDSTKPAGDGGRGPGGKGHGMNGRGGGPMGHSQDLSEVTGLTQQEIRDGLTAGKSPAEIAQEKGISRDTLVGKLKEKAEQRINEFVDSKRTAKTAPAPETAPAQ